jgi:hypothetical protein
MTQKQLSPKRTGLSVRSPIPIAIQRAVLFSRRAIISSGGRAAQMVAAIALIDEVSQKARNYLHYTNQSTKLLS